MRSKLNKGPLWWFNGLYISVILAASVFLFSSSGFGIVVVASLGDYVWYDENRDGIQDPGESGVVGVTVQLLDCAGTIIATTTTDASGKYLFENLTPGDYNVRFVLPDGYKFSAPDQGADDGLDSDADPSTGETICTTLDSGETDLTWDAGIYEPASLGDYIWKDLDADGIQDAGEPGIESVSVNLYDCSGNFIATTVTDASGFYLFDDLIPGQYYVQFVKPDGFLFSPQGQGGDTGLDSDADPGTGKTACTTLVPGENDLTWDAGLYQPASLGDYVWYDENRDGIQNDGDTGVEGVIVNLFDCTNNLLGTTTTDVDGYYLFDHLVPGCYVVQFVKPEGLEFSPQNQGTDDALDSDAYPSGATDPITLESGENDLSWDAGLVIVTTAEIGDFVWEDLDADGIQDAGEPGIAGVTVNLYDCSGNFIATTVTDAGGFYLFEDLAAGDYFLVFEAPQGYLPSPRNIGTDDGDSDADPFTGETVCTTLDSNESDRTWDAGFYRPASLGDFVWQDTDSDGIQDAGEPGIAGLTVNLYDCDDNSMIATTTTDVNGFYLFDNLTPGDYYVEFVKPAGFEFSPQDQGSDDALDSDADQATGRTVCTTLVSGENDLTWDAGLIPGPSCSLAVYKYCYVPEPPSDDFVCTKPIDSLTMIWGGTQSIRIKAWKGTVGSTLLADIDGITNGQEVTVSGYAGAPNDVIWEIFDTGTDNKIGESTFHLSCSDEDMNGPEDCGKYQGDGKAKPGYINEWILAGMVDSQSSFNCFGTDPSGDPVSECEVTLPSQVACDGKLKALVLKYMGGDCSNTTNWQDGKFTCAGDAGLNEPVRIVITKDVAELTVVPADESIMIGDEFTIVANTELRADTQFDIVQGGALLQSLKIHTSCSQPLSLGDRFGSVQVVAMDLKDGDYLSSGAHVEYDYVIENTGPVEVKNITVVDSIFGVVPGSPIVSLLPGERVTLGVTAFVEETTTNFVKVEGETGLGGFCSATASSTVTVVVPQPECIASGASKLGKVGGREEDKVEWELFNNGSNVITIDKITLSWPAALGKLRKIKLDRDTIYEPDAGNRPEPPFAVIDTWKGDIGKRQIKANDKDKLILEFEKKAKTSQNQYTILVNFIEGCSVEYVPAAVPFACEKPIDALTMIWNGSQIVRVKAWKGNVGSTLLADIDNIAVGEEVTVSGYAGSPNDVIWEIFEAGTDTKIGESKFHLSCSDQEMNGPEDCGTAQGDGKANESGLMNDWLLEGMVDLGGSFDCNP